MKKLNNRYPIFSLITLFGMSLPLFSCQITIKNDTDDHYFVFDEVKHQLVKIKKKQTVTIGDMSQLASFKLFVEGNKHWTFDCNASIMQNECGASKKVSITVSGLLRGDYSHLFTVKMAHTEEGQQGCGCGKK
jgi:hypothetical protein